MKRINKIIVLLVICLFVTFPVAAHERNDGGYYTVFDESGNKVLITGWKVEVGDQFVTENNKRYEVTEVTGDAGKARYIGDVNLTKYMTTDKNGSISLLQGILTPSIVKAQGSNKVAVYHTHSDESYVPTDGQESILGAGGIYKVGDAFTQALQAKGMEVIHSTAKHDPHDDMAYERSRRTVLDLLKQQPEAIFDIHRDAVPPEVYQTTIEGQNVSKVQLVVGKYGPTGKQIEDYALQIKAAADKQHPGLIKGIFFAKGGDYNQDLHPRSMLLEIGAHTNDRPSAERGAALFADVIPTILGKASGGAGAPAAQQSQAGNAGFGTAASGFSGASKSIGWLIGLLVVGVAAFMFLSTGSLKEAGAKLKQFTSTEFANFFGSIRKRKNSGVKNKDEDDKE